MKASVAILGLAISLAAQAASANCYLPIKYGKVDREKAVTISKAEEPVKFAAFLESVAKSSTGPARMSEIAAQSMQAEGYKDVSGFTTVDVFPPNLATGTRSIFIMTRAYSKVLNRNLEDRARIDQVTREIVIQTQCGTVELDANGQPKDLSVEGFTMDSTIGKSVPGATSSAGG
jgi:hypothetical protein